MANSEKYADWPERVRVRWWLLTIISGLSVWLRAVPERLWDWIVGQTTMMITVKNDDAAFAWMKEWFLEQRFLKRIRRVDLDTTVRNERIAMIPAPGKHWFWYGGRPFQVWFSRTENTHERSGRRVESLTFRTFGRHRAFLEPFVEDVSEILLCLAAAWGICARNSMQAESRSLILLLGASQVQS